jgi:hypothetical protein
VTRAQLLLLVALCSCTCGGGGGSGGSGGAPGPLDATTSDSAAPTGRLDADGAQLETGAPATPPGPPPQPTPATASCNVSCPRLQVVGPVSELGLPHDGSNAQTAVTFADGRWYVAWGVGWPVQVTRVQRFTSDGIPEGPALNISGTAPGDLLVSQRAGELILLGAAGPAYTSMGSVTAIHRLGLDLQVRGRPILVRAPGTLGYGRDLETTPSGELLVTSVLARPGGLVRELRIAADAAPGQELPRREWRPGSVDVVVGFQRLGEQRIFVDVAAGALGFRPLDADGTIGPATAVLQVPASETRQITFSQRVGDTTWVGGWEPKRGPIVRMRAVDPRTRQPTGEPIAISWPTDSPHQLIDASGTPMLLGTLTERTGPIRAAFVPIDPAARAACVPSTVNVRTLPDRYQTVRSVYFQGDTAGVTVDTWGGPTGERRVFFTRLRCAR